MESKTKIFRKDLLRFYKGLYTYTCCLQRTRRSVRKQLIFEKRMKKMIDELRSSIKIIRVASEREAPKLRDE